MICMASVSSVALFTLTDLLKRMIGEHLSQSVLLDVFYENKMLQNFCSRQTYQESQTTSGLLHFMDDFKIVIVVKLLDSIVGLSKVSSCKVHGLPTSL